MADLATEIGRAEVPRPAWVTLVPVLDRLLPTGAREPSAHLEVTRSLHVDRVTLTADGLRHTIGPRGSEEVRLATWESIDTSWSPRPSGALRSYIEGCAATLACWGPIVLVTTNGPRGPRCYRIDFENVPFDALQLTAALQFERGLAVPAAVVDRSQIVTLEVDGAALVGTRGVPQARPSSNMPRPELVETALDMTGYAVANVPTPARERLSLGLGLRYALLGRFPDTLREPEAVDLNVIMTESWRAGIHAVDLTYEVSPADLIARLTVHDSDAPVHTLHLDDEGHPVGAVRTCSACSRRSCSACVVPVTSCDLCSVELCRAVSSVFRRRATMRCMHRAEAIGRTTTSGLSQRVRRRGA